MTVANDQGSMWVRRIPNNQVEIDALVEILKDCDFDYGIEWTALRLGQNEHGAIEGNIEMKQIYLPEFDAQGRLKCEVDVAYAASERTDYCILSMRLWVESNQTQDDTHRIGWEVANMPDPTVLTGPITGYLPDVPNVVRIPSDKGTKLIGYKFPAFERDLLRLHPASKRERIRRMSPDTRKSAMASIFWLDDDSMIELGRTPVQSLTGADIQEGMIVRRGTHEYRIVVDVACCGPGEDGKTRCAYVEYKPNCAWNAINPKLKRGYPDAAICTTDEMAAWAHKVVFCSWDDKLQMETMKGWQRYEERYRNNEG